MERRGNLAAASVLVLGSKNVGLSTAICQTDIRTESDVRDAARAGYDESFIRTEREWRTIAPQIDAKNVWYALSFASPLIYFNMDTLAFCPLDAIAFVGVGKLKEQFERIEVAERYAAVKNYSPLISTMPDTMRLEYLNLLVEQYAGTGDAVPNLYELFMRFYFASDYGFLQLREETFEAVMAAKPAAAAEKTRRQLAALPDLVTVYRGGTDGVSCPVEKGYSWSTDINVACFFACRLGTDRGYIAQGQVKKSLIAECDLAHAEMEIIVRPNDIEVQDIIQLKGMEDVEEYLPGLIRMYQKYRDEMVQLDYLMESDIHGKAHQARVLLLCLTIAHYLKLPKSDAVVLANAAIYHDTQRDNDGEDREHGRAAARYYMSCVFDPDPVTAFLIEYHCRPDEEGYRHIQKTAALRAGKERVALLFNIFKDADALDRVRFGTRDLDFAQLRLPISKTLPIVAQIYLDNILVD